MQYKYDIEFVENFLTINSVESRVNYTDDICIVVIGHLNYIDILIKFYKGLKNIIFVVDDTEDEDKIEKLKKNNFVVLINEVSKIDYNGFGNVNFQSTSSFIGAEYVKSINKKYLIRMRSDQIILQLSDFINNFNFDRLGFFAYINNTNPDGRLIDGFQEVNEILTAKYNKEINDNNLSYNYMMDYCITGPVDDMIKIFSYFEKTQIQAPAEHKLLLTYLGESGKKFDNTFDYMKENFNFILKTLKENNIDFLMLKQDFNNWTVCLTQDSPNLYFYK